MTMAGLSPVRHNSGHLKHPCAELRPGTLALAWLFLLVPAGGFLLGSPAQTGKKAPNTGKESTPASKEIQEAGEYLPEPDLLLQYNREKKTWSRLGSLQNFRIFTGAPLVALPGFKSSVDT